MNDNDKPAVISRLATIFLCLLTECPSACHESTGFLYSLLEFVDNTGVYDLFKEIFKKDSELRVIQEFLVETKLTTYIVRILREHENLETIKCMLRLISHGANNKIMWPSFCSDEVCEALIFRSEILEIKNELWEAVNAVVCTKNVQTMKNIIPQAINLITTTYMRPTAALIYSFDFLSKIIRRSVESFTVDSVCQVLSSIISLLALVPDSSNLLGAAFRLIVSCIKIKNFTQPTLDMVLPVLVAEAPSRVRCAATANCANFILTLQDMASKDAELFKLLTKYEDYQEICSRFLPWYSNVLSSNYGGVVSIYDKGSPLMGTFSLI